MRLEMLLSCPDNHIGRTHLGVRGNLMAHAKWYTQQSVRTIKMIKLPPKGSILSNGARKHLGRTPVLTRGFLLKKPRVWRPRVLLSGPISPDIAILSLRYPISRDTSSGRLALPQNGMIPPPWYLVHTDTILQRIAR